MISSFFSMNCSTDLDINETDQRKKLLYDNPIVARGQCSWLSIHRVIKTLLAAWNHALCLTYWGPVKRVASVLKSKSKIRIKIKPKRMNYKPGRPVNFDFTWTVLAQGYSKIPRKVKIIDCPNAQVVTQNNC